MREIVPLTSRAWFCSRDESMEFGPDLWFHGADGAAAATELRRLAIDAADTNPLAGGAQSVAGQIASRSRDRPLGVVLFVRESWGEEERGKKERGKERKRRGKEGRGKRGRWKKD